MVAVSAWSAGALVMLVGRVRTYDRAARTLFVLDALWMAAAAWFLSWSLVIWPPSRDGGPAPTPALVAVAPAFGVLTVFVVFVLTFLVDRSRFSVVGLVVSALASASTVALTASAVAHRPAPAIAGSWFWWAWLVASTLLLLPERSTAAGGPVSLARQFLVHLPVAVALWVSTVQNVINHRRPSTFVAGVGFLTGILFVSRELASWQLSRSLNRQLEGKVDQLGASERDLKVLVEQQRSTAHRLEWMATHDDLTGLPNRFSLVADLDQAIVEQGLDSTALLFIDLDNFKLINDSLGHPLGDSVLQTVAARLVDEIRPGDRVARFGGDEFLVLLTGLDADREPLAEANRLRQAISRPIHSATAELYVTASVGVTRPQPSGSTGAELVRQADAAMYRAKRHGGDRADLVEPLDEVGPRRIEVASELHRAIPSGQIVPFFQPIADLADGELRGFEVLARWEHPTRGVLEPWAFIDVAEETGLVGALGDRVLADALAVFARWSAEEWCPQGLHLAVNASVRQLVDETFPDAVAEALTRSGVPGDALWFEITETALMTDVVAAGRTLGRLRGMGVHLSVDDFGTGYGSLTYLRRFPVEGVKIDRSFVQGIGRDEDDEAIVAGVIGLGHSLGLSVVAEGIEEPGQFAHLQDLGCDLGQGYLLGRPAPAAAARSAALLAPGAPVGERGRRAAGSDAPVADGVANR
jgi:diguanylate cyclase (GGDEF)-like protein